MTSAPSFQTAGVHSPSIPCLAPSLGPLHPLFPSTPCPAPSPVPLHPLSPSIPCPLPSLVSLHPVPPSSHRPPVLCPQPACGLSSKLPKSRVWSLFSPFLLARTWCFPALGIGSCCSKNSGRYRGPFLHPTAPRQGAHVWSLCPPHGLVWGCKSLVLLHRGSSSGVPGGQCAVPVTVTES